MNPPGLRVAVDVQHLFRDGIHRGDRGSIFRIPGLGKVSEGASVLHYAQALSSELTLAGAEVLTNDPGKGILTGPYYRRARAATAFRASLYLACHLNAGGGSYALAEHALESPYAARAAGAARVVLESVRQLPGIGGLEVRALAAGDRGHVCVAGFTTGPALILEPLFGDSPAHRGLMSLQGLESVGRAIARGVLDWWSLFYTGTIANRN